MHPEIGFYVHRTAGIAAAELKKKLGLMVTTGVGQSGEVGDLDVLCAVGRVTLRADTDVGSEDFSCDSQKIPACYLFLGSGNRVRGIDFVGHNAHFDIDETSMLHGMA